MAAVVGEFVSHPGGFATMRVAPDEHRHAPDESSPVESTYRRQSTSRHPPPSPYTQPTKVSDDVDSSNTTSFNSNRGSQASAPQQSTPALTQTEPESAIPTGNPPQARSSAPTPSPSDGRGAYSSPPSTSHTPVPRTSWSHDDVSHHGRETIKVRDLAHIQSFANEDFLTSRHDHGRRGTEGEVPLKYEISSMPITDIIEMVAGLLTKITTTNDRQHESLHRPGQQGVTEGTTNVSGMTSSVLAFHGKNVPSITILSYLSRIHKYCPTTYEVFLSLLVYFDRMTERVNAAPTQYMRRQSVDVYQAVGDESSSVPSTPTSARARSVKGEDSQPGQGPNEAIPFNLSHFFVVDSFNIHRLVIAGVTCASKFFSDVFYTNSRYAKVGGLPLNELNHLELQFLLLNDFRLSVPVEELEAYGTMLVEFYAREVIAQRQAEGNDSDTAMGDASSPS